MTNNINKAKHLITDNLICSKQIIINKRYLDIIISANNAQNFLYKL